MSKAKSGTHWRRRTSKDLVVGDRVYIPYDEQEGTVILVLVWSDEWDVYAVKRDDGYVLTYKPWQVVKR